MKATEQYFPVVLLIMLYKMVLTFESVNEILKCEHSNESYWAVLSCGTAHYAVQDGSNFWVCEWNPKVWPFKWKLLSSTFLWLSIMLYKVVVTFESVNKILRCNYLSESYWEVKFPVVLFFMLHMVILTFEYNVDEILKCDQYWTVLSCGTVYYAVQGCSDFWVFGWNA